MSTWMPQINPQLLQAALARGGVSPATALPSAATMATPAPGAPPPAVMPAAAPTPSMPRQPVQPMGANRTTVAPYAPQPTDMPPVPQPTAPQASRTPPPPSDDPAQNPWAKATQSASAALDQQQQALEKWQGSAPKAPNYEDYKPPLWKKIAAPFIGALAAQGHGGAEGASNAVSGALYGPWNRAQQGYQQQEQQWKEQGEGLGRSGQIAEARAKVAQEGAVNQFTATRQAETERHNQAEEDRQNKWNEIQDEFKQGTLSERNQRELDKIASQSDNLELKRQALALQGQLNAAKITELNAQANKASTAGGDQNGMTASEQREFNAQTRRYNGEIDSLNRERANYVGMPDGDFKTKALKNIDDRLDQLHSKIDESEKGIMSRRKGAAAASPAGPAAGPTGGKGFQAPKGAPAPSKPNQQLRMNGKVIATSVDGKAWGPPQ